MSTTLTKDTVVVPPRVLETELALPQLAPIETASKEPPRPARRRWMLWGLLAAAIVAVIGLATGAQEYLAHAAGAATGHSAGKASLGFQSEDAGGATAASFETVPAEVVQRSDSLRLTGTLLADELSSVASNTSGIVAAVLIDRGSVVRKNDVLVQIDATDARNKLMEGQAMLEELKARLGIGENLQAFDPFDEPEVRLVKASADLAASNLRRAEELHGKKVISAEAYDQTKTESSWPRKNTARRRFRSSRPSSVQNGAGEARYSGKGGGRHDDCASVRRLGSREAGVGGRADHRRRAGHQSGHARAGRSAAAFVDRAPAKHRLHQAGPDRAIPSR